jgi:molecular chaperone DnaK (HSP70)
MLLGIDFGTTRTVVTAVNRGNYPVVSFTNEAGDTHEWYPSVIATKGAELAFGFEAVAKQSAPGWTLRRSIKRELATRGPDSRLKIGDHEMSVFEWLTSFFEQLHHDLRHNSNLTLKKKDKLEAIISVPANANSNQRFLTLEAFRRAGFEVRGMMNEPSAAGIEYAHHILGENGVGKREHLLVYDLGGGTFDSAVISLADRDHEVLSNEGITRLGGDNFDVILLDMALKKANVHEVTEAQLALLLEECREKKEGLRPTTRKVAIDLGRGLEGAGEVSLTTADLYAECKPLIDSTVAAMEHAMQHAAAGVGLDWKALAAVYLVGGSSDFPPVARLLRERYGKQVKRSPYPHAAVAIGLAIAADTNAGHKLRERFTRHFGVWREFDSGRQIAFDALFEKDTLLPSKGEESLTLKRRYLPAHNIGHFRYLECSGLDASFQPQGDITTWDEIYFPFDPALRGTEALADVPVTRVNLNGRLIEETYSCDANGIIEVEITDLTDHFSRSFKLRGKK